MTLADRVLAALGTVYDPELDEPITELGFVGACAVSGRGEVAVRLRLPTPQCAPNFAYLMAADAQAAALSVPEVTRASDLRNCLCDPARVLLQPSSLPGLPGGRA